MQVEVYSLKTLVTEHVNMQEQQMLTSPYPGMTGRRCRKWGKENMVAKVKYGRIAGVSISEVGTKRCWTVMGRTWI
jgi:hypothetical protein